MLGAQLKMFSAKDFFLDQNYSKCSFSQMKNATFISEDTLRVKAALWNSTTTCNHLGRKKG